MSGLKSKVLRALKVGVTCGAAAAILTGCGFKTGLTPDEYRNNYKNMHSAGEISSLCKRVRSQLQYPPDGLESGTLRMETADLQQDLFANYVASGICAPFKAPDENPYMGNQKIYKEDIAYYTNHMNDAFRTGAKKVTWSVREQMIYPDFMPRYEAIKHLVRKRATERAAQGQVPVLTNR